MKNRRTSNGIQIVSPPDPARRKLLRLGLLGAGVGAAGLSAPFVILNRSREWSVGLDSGEGLLGFRSDRQFAAAMDLGGPLPDGRVGVNGPHPAPPAPEPAPSVEVAEVAPRPLPKPEVARSPGIDRSSGPAAAPRVQQASLPRLVHGERRLAFYNTHTGERFSDVYWMDGLYVPESLRAISKVLRDHRANQAHHMDQALLDLLNQLHASVDSRQAFHVISGYRSPRTNEELRKRSEGVAKNSYHTRGMAIDIFLPDRELRSVHRAALAMKAGGVGRYLRSGFIHVDTGPVRSWG